MRFKQIMPLLLVGLCSSEIFASAVEETSLVTLKESCERLNDKEVEVPERYIQERSTQGNPYVLTPHRQNYILPFSHMDDPNQEPYEQESNGRSQVLSRSWNRVYAGLGFVKKDWVVYIQPWYRTPEDKKVDDGNPNTPPAPKLMAMVRV